MRPNDFLLLITVSTPLAELTCKSLGLHRRVAQRNFIHALLSRLFPSHLIILVGQDSLRNVGCWHLPQNLVRSSNFQIITSYSNSLFAIVNIPSCPTDRFQSLKKKRPRKWERSSFSSNWIWDLWILGSSKIGLEISGVLPKYQKRFHSCNKNSGMAVTTVGMAMARSSRLSLTGKSDLSLGSL